MTTVDAPDLNFQPHVLVITDCGDGSEKEWEIEHPATCPVVCDWTPYLSEVWNGRGPNSFYSWMTSPEELEKGDPGHRTCYIEYEIENIGLDGLDVYSLSGKAHLDQTYKKLSPNEPDWMMLLPGRYLIQGWYSRSHDPYIEDDGGISLLGVAA